MQKIAADHIILWISESDRDQLPGNVKKLTKFGLTIKFCEDIKSYKKIVPALKQYPNCYIVTADDDVHYASNWLERLVSACKESPGVVVCHRAHRIKLDQSGLPLEYGKWELEVNGSEISPLIFPTGVGGVIYPPNCFYPDAVNEEKFSSLCPFGDDIWLFWMTRLRGVSAKVTKHNFIITPWRGSQLFALWIDNVDNKENDIQIARMVSEYGFAFINTE